MAGLVRISSVTTPASKPTITIRRAVPRDFAVIGELARRIWRISFAGMISGEQIEYMLELRYTPTAMHEATSGGRLIYELLLRNEAPLAFAAHGPTDSESEWKLQQLYVDPDWQRHGFGGRLLDHVEKEARQRRKRHLVLTVNRNNHRARAAYEHRGFVIRREAQFDIGQGYVMDDYVMAKDLGPAS